MALQIKNMELNKEDGAEDVGKRRLNCEVLIVNHGIAPIHYVRLAVPNECGLVLMLGELKTQADPVTNEFLSVSKLLLPAATSHTFGLSYPYGQGWTADMTIVNFRNARRGNWQMK